MADTAELFNQALDALEAGDVSAARAGLEAVLLRDPTDGEAVLQLARLLRDEEDDAVAAERLLNEYIPANPGYVPLLVELADVRLSLGDPHGAARPLKRALVLEPNRADTLFLLANAFQDLGHYAEATRSYQASLDSDPFSEDTWFNLGQCREALGDAPGALEAWRSYLRVAPPDAQDRAEVEAAVAALEAAAEE